MTTTPTQPHRTARPAIPLRHNQDHTRLLWLVVPLCLALGLVTALWGIGLIGTAHAATATLTTCTESALESAIASAASGDTITFGCNGTITLTSTLVISQNLSLDSSGHSVTLDGGNNVRVLLVNSGVTLGLNALTIAHGTDSGSGGGLYTYGTVNITNSTFSENTASSGYGGGVFNAGGTVSITNSTFTSNAASGGFGGGLYNQNGSATIASDTFSNNTATYGGGGLDNSGSASVNITNSTFSGNTALDGGGLGNTGGASASITNSTFTGNTATEVGGGIFNQGATTAIASSTISGNVGPGGSGGGMYNESGTARFGGSIVAGNSGGNCAGASVTSTGNNLESGSDCGFTSGGDLQNSNPQLGALASNGGPTQTLALRAGSPAIDHIPATSCPATDQRGVRRLDNGEASCDVGAYEYVDPVDKDLALSNVPANMTVNATSPAGAVVTYTTPTVVDEDSPLPVVSCAPSSGATFATGTTTVTCTVSDGDDTNSPASASFMVTVQGAAPQVSALITTVNSFGLADGLQNSYDQQLRAVQQDLSASNPAQACVDLSIFISHVQAQSGKALTATQAAQLVTAAQQIQAVLGC